MRKFFPTILPLALFRHADGLAERGAGTHDITGLAIAILIVRGQLDLACAATA